MEAGNWVQLSPTVMWADRITTRNSTGITPYRIAFGQECLLPHPSPNRLGGVADRKAMERAENESRFIGLTGKPTGLLLMRIAFSDRENSPPRSNSMMTSCYLTSGLDTPILAPSNPQNGFSWFTDTLRKEAGGT